MSKGQSLYNRVVRVTHVYLGPAADRFIDRQIQNHLHKNPEDLTVSDLSMLVDWIQVAVSFLTEDSEIIEEYIEQLTKLTRQPVKKGNSSEA